MNNIDSRKSNYKPVAAVTPVSDASPVPATSTDSVVVLSSLCIDYSMLSSAPSFESLFPFCGFWLMLL